MKKVLITLLLSIGFYMFGFAQITTPNGQQARLIPNKTEVKNFSPEELTEVLNTRKSDIKNLNKATAIPAVVNPPSNSDESLEEETRRKLQRPNLTAQQRAILEKILSDIARKSQ